MSLADEHPSLESVFGRYPCLLQVQALVFSNSSDIKCKSRLISTTQPNLNMVFPTYRNLRVWRVRVTSSPVVDSGSSSSSTTTGEDSTPAGIFVVQINRPARRNCVDLQTSKELFHAFANVFESDQSLKVAVLCGAGKDFCAGYDLQEAAGSTTSSTSRTDHSTSSSISTAIGRSRSDFFKEYDYPSGSAPSPTPHKTNTSSSTVLGRGDSSDSVKNMNTASLLRGPMGPSRLFVSKPVIASVHGHAVAGGLELCLWCDLIVCGTAAVFGVYCRRFGVPLIDGGTVRLAKVVGLNRARDMVLTGRAVGAEEARQFGLVSRVVDVDLDKRTGAAPSPNTGGPAVLDAAIDLAKEIARNPENCMKSDRRSLYEAMFLDPGAEQQPPDSHAMRREYELGRAVIASGETQRGADRFARGKVGRHGAKL